MMAIGQLIQSFRLKWLGRIVDETDSYWKDTANLYFVPIWGSETTFELFRRIIYDRTIFCWENPKHLPRTSKNLVLIQI